MRGDGHDDSREVARALSFLGWTLDEAEFRRHRRSFAAGTGVVCAAGAWFLVASPPLSLVVGVVAAVSAWVGVRRAVLGLARLRRTRALGGTGTLLGLVVLRMRVEPTVETAVDFAVDAGDGALARSLGVHARRGRGSGESGLASFAAEWGAWFPAVGRAAALVAAATDATDGDETLERALTAVQRGTRDELADFVGEIRGPVSGVYAFGVLLPLALVGLLPAARVAGLGVSVTTVAAVYDVALPSLLLGASAWLLVRRPVAFPPPRVGRAHPGVPDRRPHALVGGVAVACAAWVLAGRLVAPWASPVAAAGFGLGTALVVVAAGPKRVRDRVRAVESGLPDALATVGRRVVDGEAPETAISGTGATLSGATGERLAVVGRRMERLGVGPRRALLGPAGAFADLPSRRVGSAASMLALTATEGASAGRALVSMAAQFDAFADIESEARRELGRVTDTLTNTATAFGPLVAGATVALAARVAAEGSGTLGGGLPVASLGLAVGGYVLVSAVVLVGLSTALLRGLDPALLAYRVGLALPTATATYLASVVGAGLLVGA